MCGIFAVVQTNQDAGMKVFEGLKRLEYRGYDSWGVTVIDQDQLKIEKHVGKVSQAKKLKLPVSSTAIGHTRWATHGGVTQVNAHPHLASDGSFALAQNGVVENWRELKHILIEEGSKFVTETDTEVIVRLIESCQKKQHLRLKEAILEAFRQLKGRNTIIVLAKNGAVYAARNGSPLLIGRTADQKTYFCSSDVLSLAPEVAEYAVIENGQFVEIEDGQYRCLEVKAEQEIILKFQTFDLRQVASEKGKYADFMLKEIHDTPAVIEQVILTPKVKINELSQLITAAQHIYTIGSGTAGIAAAQIAFFLRKYGHVHALSLVGADATEYLDLIQPGDVCIAPSQSGETADVLEILEKLKSQGVRIITYVNMPSSSMTRLADLSFLANAGPEVSVMSTKVFTSQIAWGYLVAKAASGQYESGLEQLKKLAKESRKYLGDEQALTDIHNLANFLRIKHDIFLLAKGENFQIIREGMVKLIEGSYIHAHALPAGDLKHYAITLMEPGVPVIVMTSNDDVRNDVLTAAQEVKARGATVIHIGSPSNEKLEHQLELPDLGEVSSVLHVLPLQLLAHELAGLLGHDIDHPRNIAKSVTVK